MPTSDRRPILPVILALLLMSTTPVGTGRGVHQFDLIHPLFAHLHLYGGRLLTHEQLEQVLAAPHGTPVLSIGPAFAAGSATPSDDAGLGLSPTLPMQTMNLFASLRTRRVELDVAPARQLDEAPPHPPPTTAFA
ncbi:MAG: hypothetical protein JOZ81_23565 [Chloroflexi bacterium]|nr:hypothetical protein [Chloroflexota bacterium]